MLVQTALIVILVHSTILLCESSLLLGKEEYFRQRNLLVKMEADRAFGGDLSLEGREIPANECLMRAKLAEVDYAFEHPGKFAPATNFLEAKKTIEHSRVFEIIRKMPKGGLFHAHTSAIATPKFFLTKVLDLPHLHVCVKKPEIKFVFSRSPDRRVCAWETIPEARANHPNFESSLLSEMSMLASDPSAMSEDINVVWAKFQRLFDTLKGLVDYRPVFEMYFYEALKLLVEDNVMFLELRTSFSKLYELDGRTHGPLDVAKIYQTIVERFRKDHPHFLGVKAIYSPRRNTNKAEFSKHVENFRNLQSAFPDFVKGFDMVGQEDLGQPLVYFIDELLQLGKITNFFFHVGETNWYGHSTDENLYDAVLLHTKRIGHGNALIKHPKLMEMVKNQSIAIELNPISNQVLRLVDDLRNHPASHFFAANFPLVVASDDPSYWGAKGLSYDFYEAFVGMMSRKSDLRALKKLALNSIEYSTLSRAEKNQALKIFKREWSEFVNGIASACPV